MDIGNGVLDIGCSNFEIPIRQVRHAKAVNTNLRNQLKRGNFEIASRETGETPILHSLFKAAGRMPAFLKYNFLHNKCSTGRNACVTPPWERRAPARLFWYSIHRQNACATPPRNADLRIGSAEIQFNAPIRRLAFPGKRIGNAQ
jgi:hypothetical protein